MAKTNQMLWIILGALGIGGLIFLLRKPAPVVAAAPAVARIPGVPAVAPVREVGVRGQLISTAMQQSGLPQEELTVRSLLPLDVGLNTWTFNLPAIGGWNTVANTNVGDNRFICLKSISYAGTAAESIRITAGSSVVMETSIERIPGITTTHTASIREVVVEQNMPIRVEVYASAISGTDNLIISGTVVEKKGMVLA